MDETGLDTPAQRRGRKNRRDKEDNLMAAQFCRFVLGTFAPVAIVGWLLVLH
jgi:hypothetical protein